MGIIQLELDEEVASLLRRQDRSAEDAARELIATELYRRGVISRGKASEVLALSLEDFLHHAAGVGNPYFDFTEDEWEDEKRTVREIAASRRPSVTPAR